MTRDCLAQSELWSPVCVWHQDLLLQCLAGYVCELCCNLYFAVSLAFITLRKGGAYKVGKKIMDFKH